MDVLSDVLRAVRLTGALFFDVDAGTPWVGESPSTATIAATMMPEAEHVISFHAVISGSCWVALTDGSMPPERLDAGDVAIFPSGLENVMSSERGARGRVNMALYYNPMDGHLPFRLMRGGDGADRTRFVCGYLGCDTRPFNPLLTALPPMLCVRKPARMEAWVTDLFRLALEEGGSGRIGGEAILARLSELMFVEVLRQHVEALPEDSRGWLSGLRDPQVGAALQLIHAFPAENWTLERLAQRVAMSRSRFAARFSHYVNVSPIQYLARWRMQLAARQLEAPSASIAQVAAGVGYDSEAAFNRAFKRQVGAPPGVWRRARVGQAAAVAAVNYGPAAGDSVPFSN